MATKTKDVSQALFVSESKLLDAMAQHRCLTDVFRRFEGTFSAERIDYSKVDVATLRMVNSSNLMEGMFIDELVTKMDRITNCKSTEELDHLKEELLSKENVSEVFDIDSKRIVLNSDDKERYSKFFE
ncbi:hypothetical protein PCE1_001120 [Barthelona sp. PCE]